MCKLVQKSDDEFTTHISSREIEAGVAPFARVVDSFSCRKGNAIVAAEIGRSSRML